jgi:magnesium chelatase family protein
MNPCPCGYQGDAGDRCKCNPGAVARYRSRISGPLLDRIDIRVEVARPSMLEMRGLDIPPTDPANAVCSTQQIAAAQLRQQQRAGCLNARLPVRRLATDCALGPAATQLLERSVAPLALTGRGLHRLLRISRTIADLAESGQIEAEHLAEAIQLRRAI